MRIPAIVCGASAGGGRFHAGGEAARILATSIDYLRQGQIALRDAATP